MTRLAGGQVLDELRDPAPVGERALRRAPPGRARRARRSSARAPGTSSAGPGRGPRRGRSRASAVKTCRSGQKRTRVPGLRARRTARRRAAPTAWRTPRPGPRRRTCPARRGGTRSGGPSPSRSTSTSQPRAQRVDHAGAHAVQPAGGRVGAAAELAARVQLGHHDLDAGQPGPRLHVHRDAAAVVVDLDRPVRRAGSRRSACTTRPGPRRRELSRISHRQCISPRESVDPMYMPGRLRTASRPSSTDRCCAE